MSAFYMLLPLLMLGALALQALFALLVHNRPEARRKPEGCIISHVGSGVARASRYSAPFRESFSNRRRLKHGSARGRVKL